MMHAQKAALRAEFRALRAALSPEERTGLNQLLWGQIFHYFLEVPPPKTLLLYAPLPHEISLIPIFNHARERGIACAFPRCGAKKGEMEFYYVEDLRDLADGKFGICEPKEDAIPVTDLTDALMFVPALAFDRAGYRIGYGGGYYDRYLAEHRMRTVGVTYEAFIADSLPHDKYDIAVDTVITEKRCITP